MNKMAKGDKYLAYLNETLERAVKPCSALLAPFLTWNRRFWTPWSVHIGQVGGRWVIRSRIHFVLVLSRVNNNEERDEDF